MPDHKVLACQWCEGQTGEGSGKLVTMVGERSAGILTVAFLLNKSKLARCSVGGQTDAIQILSP